MSIMEIENVSQLITTSKVATWGNGEVITIKAGTGVGKSYFIKNTLYEFAQANNKRILMLIHRLNCTNQFELELERDKKNNIIDIRTYQSLENVNKDFDFSVYDYIVCDEFHYFLSDSPFNIFTDVSLNLILKQTNSIRIFMSATGDYMKRYLTDVKDIKTRDYELPINFNFIEKLNFYNDEDTVQKLIEKAIKKGDKVIVFIQSATKAYELYKKYKKHCLFNCGKSDQHYKYVNKDKIKDMLINERFEELILITTTCMDAGVNIHDKEVNNIICDVKDIGVLIQCIGRKRLENLNDKICLYIKTINNNQLSGIKRQLILKVSKADFLREHTVKEYLEKFVRQNDFNNIVYAESVTEDDKSTHKVNELMYFKCKLDIVDILDMRDYGDYGYCKFIADKFGLKDIDGNFNYSVIEEIDNKNMLSDYLESIIGISMLQVKDRKKLIEKIDVKSDGKLLRKINNLNGALEERKISYRVVEFPVSMMIEGKQKRYPNAWRIQKLIS